MNKETPLELYQDAVLKLAMWLAECYCLAFQKEQGNEVDERRVVFARKMAELFQEHLFHDQEEMGFEPSVDAFLDNNAFNGFAWKDGKFEGSVEKAQVLLKRFINGFPQRSNHYEYECAVFLREVAKALEAGGAGNLTIYPEKLWLLSKKKKKEV